jgi:hypothetical protein
MFYTLSFPFGQVLNLPLHYSYVTSREEYLFDTYLFHDIGYLAHLLLRSYLQRISFNKIPTTLASIFRTLAWCEGLY